MERAGRWEGEELVAGVRLYRACSARADLYITDI
jgi:hypothetical protein